MTSLDRAFMKVFADAPVASGRAPGPHAPRAKVAETSHRPLVAIAAREPLTLAAPTSPTPREASEPLAPLSTFSAAAKHERSVRASVEIDELAWPKACCDILEHAARGWDRFADDLCERLTRGGQCIAIASRAPGDGRTTVVLAAAKHLAARGIRTLVVEANFERPNLAQCCRITPQAGWADVVDGDRSLDEVLIVAVADGVALLPWQSRGREAAMPGDTVRVTATFETLKEQYDLVLLDTAPLASPAATTAFAALADAARVDAVYMISDARATAIGQLEGVCANLRQAGLTVDGIIENFADPTELGGGRMRVKLHELAGRIFAARE